MLLEIYIGFLLSALAILSLSLLSQSTARIIFSFLSFLLFSFLTFSSGIIERNYCEYTTTGFQCHTLQIVDTSLMVLNIGLGLLALINIFASWGLSLKR